MKKKRSEVIPRGLSVLEVTLAGEPYAVLSFDEAASQRAEPPTLADDAPLTASERAVVELAVAGLSNEEIAGRRNVSRRTVAKQLSSAYHKLGVGSRRGLLSQYLRARP